MLGRYNMACLFLFRTETQLIDIFLRLSDLMISSDRFSK